MTPTLGKRKWEGTGDSHKEGIALRESSGSQDGDAQAVFKRYFEAQFKPLPKVKKDVKVSKEAPDDEREDETDWGGISDVDDDGAVEVIEHTSTESHPSMSREELRKFMSSNPPTNNPASSMPQKSTTTPAEDDLSEADNLKKDLALQRLLSESHLLDAAGGQELSGANKHKVTDLRVRSLGAKTSILVQEKMPLSHRRGITAKQTEREDKRRREARENGIVLERVKMAKRKEGRRDRGVGGPGVGKFTGGTLTLSKKDVFAIEGPRRKLDGNGARGGRGGRGRGGKSGKRAG